MRRPTEPFATFIDSFMVAKTLAPTTREDYMRYLKQFDTFTGHTSLKTALTLDNAAQWVDSMKARGTHTARNGAMALKSFASWIKKTRYIVIPGGGSLLAGLETPSVPKGSRHAFSDEELDLIYGSLEHRPNKDRARARAVIYLMAQTGLRRNEARQLTREDIFLVPEKGRGSIKVRAITSKGNKERIVRLGADAIRAIDEYLNADGKRPHYTGPAPEPVFLTEQGKPFTKNGWGTWLDRVWDDIEKATAIKASSHWLRHKWASDYNRGMRFTGNNVYDLKREGGWADLNIPLRYTHDRPEEELLSMPTPIDALREHAPKVRAV